MNGEHIKWIIAIMKTIYFIVQKDINISKINILPFLIILEILLSQSFISFPFCEIWFSQNLKKTFFFCEITKIRSRKN